MTHALVLTVAEPDRNGVRALWKSAALFEPVPSMQALGYPPHLTLIMAELENPTPMIAAMRTVFAHVAPMLVSKFRVQDFSR